MRGRRAWCVALLFPLAACAPKKAPPPVMERAGPVIRGEVLGGNTRALSLPCRGEATEVVLHMASPRWPAETTDGLREGEVMVRFRVAADGGFVEPQAVKATHPAFVRPALQAMEKSRFQVHEGVRDCVVGKEFALPIRFVLEYLEPGTTP